jgi:hypothetical protein
MNMKKIILVVCALSAFSFLSAEKYYKTATSNSLNQAQTNQAGKTGVGDCAPSNSQRDLDINNVRARLLGGGDFWWDGVSNARYEIPKVDVSSNAIPINAIFAGALWFTGVDNGGNLKVAAQTYRNQGHDFWPGPLDVITGEVNFAVCNAYDRHFEVKGEAISEHIAKFIDAAFVPPSDIPNSIKYWPGQGNPHLLNPDNPAFNGLYYADGPVAPFYDANKDGIYTPEFGDFPVIGVLVDDTIVPTFADQMIFWVINDMGQVHGRTGGEALGVQVNCLAFAYQTSDALNDMTFYTYEIVKRTPGSLFQTYMGLFVDPDLGTYTDDYVGCDTIRSIGYVYNANACDGLYGCAPNLPIVAIDYFEGPRADDGSELGMSSFFYFNNAASGCQTDPGTAPEFRNYHLGLDKCGNQWVYGGTGVLNSPGATSQPTTYIYPGNPARCSEAGNWSEVTPNPFAGCGQTPIAPADRRFLQNSGPFTLRPGQFQRITVGVMAVFPQNYNGRPDIEREIGPANDLAQTLFDNGFQLTDGPDAPTLRIRELANRIIINLINEPSSNNFGESYSQRAALPDDGNVYPDSTYKFQGYKVYQIRNPRVTAQDLDDESKAKLIFQVDIKDEIAEIYNFELAPTGFFNSVLKVEGANEGIVRSFEVTDDVFASGDRKLVNNKPYYFAAISYAYNNFIPFEIPLPNPLPQFSPYLQGRRNFRIYSAIPHAIDSRNGGTVLNVEYGTPLLVERLEGSGNGGVATRLSRASIDAILSSPLGFEDIISFELGRDPLKARVIDPLLVQNADFEMRFKSFINGVDTNIIGDSTVWEIYVRKNGVLVDTIFSDRPLDRQYEQIIEEYGISVNLGVVSPVLTNLQNDEPIYQPISSSIRFSDLSNQWLTFIEDEGFNTPKNWIRSGTSVEAAGSAFQFIFDSHQYDHLPQPLKNEFYDSENLFAKMLDGGIAPYCLASNYGNPNAGSLGNDFRPDFLHGPGFRWHIYDVGAGVEVRNPVNTLEKLNSVQIVLTSDRSKWSKCIVFETGEDDVLTIGNARKGMLRQSNSKRLDGTNEFGEVGRSWFPGYAINLETGERLNISFGESSEYADNNGADMVWNPTDRVEANLTPILGTDANRPIWGGKHFIYVWETTYDEGDEAHAVLTANHNLPANPSQVMPAAVAELYEKIMYAGIPLLAPGRSLALDANGQVIIPSDIEIFINIERPFDVYTTSESFGSGSNNGLPRYRFSTVGMAPDENVTDVATSALDKIRVVPNPYYAYSAYEESQIDNVVKITNLPNRCTVSIYSLDGKLVRRYDRAVGTNFGETSDARQEISSGNIVGQGINLDNSLNWDLNNQQRIPVGSGTYIIHVDAPGIGQKTIKSVVFLRPTDVSNF